MTLSHHDTVAIDSGHGGREKRKGDLVLRTSQGNGWTNDETEKETPNTCRPIRSHGLRSTLTLIPRFI